MLCSCPMQTNHSCSREWSKETEVGLIVQGVGVCKGQLWLDGSCRQGLSMFRQLQEQAIRVGCGPCIEGSGLWVEQISKSGSGMMGR
jgi:hypothetical protein